MIYIHEWPEIDRKWDIKILFTFPPSDFVDMEIEATISLDYWSNIYLWMIHEIQ